MADAKKKANHKSKTRAIKRDELRRYLAERGKVSYVFDLVEELEDDNKELEPTMVQRKKIAIDTRLRLLNKYLPDEKSVEVKNAEGEKFETDNKWVIEVTSAKG